MSGLGGEVVMFTKCVNAMYPESDIYLISL